MYVRVTEACSHLKLAPNTVRKYCDRGILESKRTDGGHRLVKIDKRPKNAGRKSTKISERKDYVYVRVSTYKQKDDLLRQKLSEPNDKTEKWKKLILSETAGNAKALIDLIPEIVLLIGEQPQLPPLPAKEIENRNIHVYQNFLLTCCNTISLCVVQNTGRPHCTSRTKARATTRCNLGCKCASGSSIIIER